MDEETEVKITYETLFDILRREKSRDELQKLSPTFYKDLITYLEEKKRAEQQISSPLNEVSLQILNIRKMVRELYDRREKKILFMAMDKARSGSTLMSKDELLAEELDMFNRTSDLITRYRVCILQRLLQSQLPEIVHASEEKPKDELPKIVTVLFKEPVQRFFGRNLEPYGPFNSDDIANIPSELADVLVKSGKAESLQKTN